MQLNCQSINANIVLTKLLTYSLRPHFLCLSETWLKNNKKLPKFLDYHHIWRHRPGLQGGGLGILIRIGVQYQEIPLKYYKDGILEAQAVKIYDKNKNPISILNIYRAPDLKLTLAEIKHYVQQLGSKFIITGDFNAHSPILDDLVLRPDATGKIVEDLILKDNISLINPKNFYTRIATNAYATKSCLDLCLTSPNLADKTSVELGLDVGSDHFPVLISIQISPAFSTINPSKKWKFTPENLFDFKNSLPTSKIIKPATANELAKDISDRIFTTALNTIPRTSGQPREGRCTPWWDDECAVAKKAKRDAKKLLIRCPNGINVDNYKDKEKSFKKIIAKKKQKSFQDFISELDVDTPISKAHQKVRALKGYPPPPDAPLVSQGIIITDDVEKAQTLAYHYEDNSQTFSHKNLTEFEPKLLNAKKSGESHGYNKPITIQELLNTLKHVQNTAPGADKIPYMLLKNLPPHAMDELLYLYNTALHTGVFPELWKEGVIIPILKPGKPKEDPSSYRPITLLSCIGKIFERILKKRLEYIIEKDNLLSPSQTGFRIEQGTIDCLLRMDNTIRTSMSQNKTTIMIYIDLKNAFDSIWCEGLVSKLIDLGIKGNMLAILYDFLKNRPNKVTYNGSLSETFISQAGTPQGSVLSPSLFNLMLQDIPKNDSIQLYIYADDVSISCTDADINTARRNIQSYMKTLLKWCEEWGLKLNHDKTYIQYFSKKAKSYPIVRIENRAIKYKKTHKVLGMVLDSPKLSWRDHLVYLVSDCQRRLDLMKILSSPVWGASLKILRQHYIAYIRSKIDYGSILYHSSHSPLLNKLEVIQNTAMRLMTGARKTSPILSLQIESHIPPLKLHRGYLILKNYLKLMNKPTNFETSKALGLDDPLVPNPPLNSFRDKIKFQLLDHKLNPINRTPCPTLSPLPPWNSINHLITSYYNHQELNSNEKFNNYVNNKFPNFTSIYTDGSKSDSLDSVGCGMYIPITRLVHCWKLNNLHSVVASELYAIYKALSHIDSNLNNDVIILTDSKTALLLIKSSTPKTYKNIVFQIQVQILHLSMQRNIHLHWVKGHQGVTGNEIADKAANKAHSNAQIENFPLTCSEILSIYKKASYDYWKQYWEDNVEFSNKGTFLFNLRDGNINKNLFIFNDLKRREQVLLTRLRIGHAGVNSYLSRFRIIPNQDCSNCGAPVGDFEHYFFDCTEFETERHVLESSILALGFTSVNLKILFSGSTNPHNLDITKLLMTYILNTNMHKTL